jgi:hypothetical protein
MGLRVRISVDRRPLVDQLMQAGSRVTADEVVTQIGIAQQLSNFRQNF